MVAFHLAVPTSWHVETATVAVAGSATPGTSRDTLIFAHIITSSPGEQILLDLTFACTKSLVELHMTCNLVSVSVSGRQFRRYRWSGRGCPGSDFVHAGVTEGLSI